MNSAGSRPYLVSRNSMDLGLVMIRLDGPAGLRSPESADGVTRRAHGPPMTIRAAEY